MFPASLPPWFERDGTTGEYTSGFLLDFIAELKKNAKLQDIVLEPITDPNYANDFTGVTLKWLKEGRIDLGWDSNTTLSPGFSYTQAFFDNENGMLTKRTSQPVTKWQVFAPFETELWLMLLLAIGLGSLTISLLTAIYTDQTFKDALCTFPSFFYHTWAALLGGDEYDLYHFPPWGRLYRLGLLFLVLVTSATYTANLAAFLTRPNFQIHGPKTVEELQTATICNRWAQYHNQLGLWADKVISIPPEMPVEQRGEWARQALSRGDCDAIVEIKAFLKPESLEHCNTMHYHSDVTIHPTPLYLVLPEGKDELTHHLSQAILTTIASPVYPSLIAKHMKFNASCPDTDTESELEQISLEQMAAVFITYFACAIIAVGLTAARRAMNKGKRLGEVKYEVQNEKLDGKLDRVLAEIQAMKTSVGVPGRSYTSPKLIGKLVSTDVS